MAYVVFRETDAALVRRVDLKPGANRLGRGRENEITLAQGRLSRAHARLDVADGRVTLHDLGSSNGTTVRGARVTSATLRNGDVFSCGDIEFQLVLEPADELEHTLTPGGATVAGARKLEELLVHNDHASAIRVRPGGDRDSLKLKVLLEVSRVLSSPGTTNELLGRVLDLLFRVFDVDRAALIPVDESTGDLGEAITSAKFGPAGPEPIYSRHIVQQVRTRAEGVVLMDAIADPKFGAVPSVQAVAIRSAMCVPLIAKGAVLGVLYVDHLRVPARYGDEDLEFLASFGAQAATAIENGRLYGKLENEAVQRGKLLRFFPPAVLKPLLERPGFGEPRDHDVTVLFSDISGFTSMSSSMSSRDIVSLLNRYFPPMAEIVFRHEGTLEKYIGDALMAIWGAPVAHDDDADRALMAAMEMTAVLERLNLELMKDGVPPLAVHIGLNTGPVTFGNIGSADYVQFAAIGDTTNVASRVCSVAEAGEVVIAATTMEGLRHASDWILQPRPLITVKGKDEPLELYGVRRRA